MCDQCFGINGRSAVVYNEISQKLIVQLKFCRQTHLVPFMGHLMQKCDFFDDVDVIIPVPLHYKKLVTRGYNQSSLLAKYLSRNTNIPVNASALIKTKDTSPQSSCSIDERLTNLKGCFKLKQQFKNKTILLVDDVLTTGATIKEAAKLFHGAKEIKFVTFARSVKNLNKI